MRYTSGGKHSTLAPRHAPAKTGNYSNPAATTAIKSLAPVELRLEPTEKQENKQI